MILIIAYNSVKMLVNLVPEIDTSQLQAYTTSTNSTHFIDFKSLKSDLKSRNQNNLLTSWPNSSNQ